MSWIVPWQGRDYDIDPSEFSGLELKQVKLRTSLTYKQLIQAVGQLDGEAICALFWTVDRRDNPDLRFEDYGGPPIKLIVAHLDGFEAAMDDLGKAIKETQPTSGSPGSPSSSDTPETSTTP